MAKDNGSQEEGRYEVIKNNSGEILILISCKAGGPENPRIVYDGGEKALLYRSRESSIMLGGIPEEARPHIKAVDEALIVEVEGTEVAREYMCPIRSVKSLDNLIKIAQSTKD